jgi:hypothetical protein
VAAERSVIAVIASIRGSRNTNSMNDIEGVLVSLFQILRNDLNKEASIGLALKAEGREFTLRIRSKESVGDRKRPYFAVVVGVSDEAFRISYNPSGAPSAESRVVIIAADAADELLDLVRSYVEAERHRLAEYEE